MGTHTEAQRTYWQHTGEFTAQEGSELQEGTLAAPVSAAHSEEDGPPYFSLNFSHAQMPCTAVYATVADPPVMLHEAPEPVGARGLLGTSDKYWPAAEEFAVNTLMSEGTVPPLSAA